MTERAPSPTATVARLRVTVTERWQATVALVDRLLVPTAGRTVRVHLLVVAFQALVLMAALHAMRTWRSVAGVLPVHLQWPVTWSQWLPWKGYVIGLAIAAAVAAAMAVVLYRHRWARLLSFTGLLFWVATLNSFGKVGHAYHHLLFAAGAVALLPTLARPGRPDPRTPRHLATILTGQAVVLFTYTMSGIWKLLEGVQALRQGRPSMFTDLSLAALVNRQVSAVGGEPPLAWMVLDRPLLASVLYVVTVFVELFALATLFTPRVAAVGAAILATFHLAVIWTMDISFIFSIGALVLLFGLSPLLERPDPDPSGPGPG